MFEDVIRRALAEDLGTAGDLSTTASIGAEVRASGRVVARQPGCIAGIGAAALVVERVAGGVAGSAVDVSVEVADGDRVEAGTTLLSVTGSARTILTAERTALNLLGHLSGIATATAAAVDVVAATDARIADTRKTTPGLRAVEKYAVRCGGGSNHRFGLHDAVMLKDNHLAAAGSITAAVRAVRDRVGHTVTITVEVDRLEQLGEVLDAGADIVLLDNMDPPMLRSAVEQVDGRAITEASGGITLETVQQVAATGVDVISLGWLTHSAPRLDVALDLDDA
ncbi:MAG: carboxylating nicotinate-nucleotide diphosphorylase [Nitriliruptor sp.]|nr:MAG: carboxylating nicotinate-nucleotide diphosphorylase [Nitriliruptor sp.]